MSTSSFTRVAVTALVLSSLNPRKSFNDKTISELADSIAAHGGLIQPVTLRKKGKKFEVIAGERRTRALQELVARGTWPKTSEIDARLIEATDAEALTIALAENSDREDVHPMEQADGFRALHRLGLSDEEISVKLGKDVSVVRHLLNLSSGVSDLVRQLFFEGVINLKQAGVFASFKTTDQDAYLEGVRRESYADDQYEHISEEATEALSEEEHEALQAKEPEWDYRSRDYRYLKDDAQPTVTYSVLADTKRLYAVLMGDKIPVSRAAFDIEEYRERGGTTSGHLFIAEQQFIDNRELFMELQREAMAVQAEEANDAGLWSHIHGFKESPDYNDFMERERFVTFWLAPNGEIMRKDGFGPKVYSKEEVDALLAQKAAGKSKGGSATARANTARIRLEDKAINQAVEDSLMGNARLTQELLILTFLGTSGLRLRLETPSANPHEGYHASSAIAPVARFYAQLEAAGVKLSDRNRKQNDTDPLMYVSSGSEHVAGVLAGYADEEVSRLLQGLTTLSLTHVHDGTLSGMHSLVLARTEADPAPFFNRDERYLAVTKNKEYEAIMADLGAAHAYDSKTKKTNVAYIKEALWEKYQAWVPERLRAFGPQPETEETPENVIQDDPNAAPFDVDESEDMLADAA